MLPEEWAKQAQVYGAYVWAYLVLVAAGFYVLSLIVGLRRRSQRQSVTEPAPATPPVALATP